MKKYISYIWPITKRFPSTFNGELEVTWINGKKVLDSKDANYSYGSLQKILSFGLSKTTIKSTGNVLLLGMGAGCIINPIHQNGFNGDITSVEIDSDVINIAEKEFGITPNEHLNIVCEDALSFVNHCSKSYNLIIVDLFINNLVPSQFYDINFWDKVKRLTEKQGSFIFNAGLNNSNPNEIKSVFNKLNNRFKTSLYNNVNNTNTLIVSQHY